MSVSSTLSKVTYQGDGSSTNFSFMFAIPGGNTVSQSAQFLQVTIVNAQGVSSTVVFGPGATQFQLTLNAPIQLNPTPVGGTVTYGSPLIGGTPLPFGSTITIQRVMPLTQLTSLQNQGVLWQTVIEQALDYLTMLDQQFTSSFGQFLQGNPTDPTGLVYTATPVAQRANTFLAWDGSGNLSSGVTPATGIISAPMAPVVGAASLAAGRTAFGLGTVAVENIGGGLADDGATNLRVLFSVNKVNASTGIGASNYLQKIKATGPITLTLARGNTLFPGFGFWVEVLPQSGGNVTLAINANDSIENGPSGASVIIFPGNSAWISTDAATNATWYIELIQGSTNSTSPMGDYAGGLSIDVLTNTTATASVGAVVLFDGIYFYTSTPSGGINTATTGVGGLDTGAMVANTFYTVWAIYNPASGTSAWMISLATTLTALKPTLPTGYTAAAPLGVLKTAPASAVLMGTRQRGNKVEYQPGVAGTGAALPNPISNASGSISVPTWTSVSLTSYVPLNAKSYDLFIVIGNNAGPGTGVMAAPNGNSGASGSVTNPAPLQLSGFQTTGAGLNANLPVTTGGTFIGAGPVFYASNFSGGGTGLWIRGFDLNL